MAPFGLRKMLNWIKERYGDWEIIITENGVSDKGEIDDQPRIDYYRVRYTILNWRLKLIEKVKVFPNGDLNPGPLQRQAAYCADALPMQLSGSYKFKSQLGLTLCI